MAAAAYRVEEEHMWKCSKHPSKRRRHGVCPACLRDRLVSLCPYCANPRPCSCNAVLSNSSSSSSSSFAGDVEPALPRSRSVSVPFFLRSNTNRVHTASFASVFSRSKTKRSAGDAKNDGGDMKNDDGENREINERIENFAEMISRSRSVGVGRMASGKGRFWNWKAFRSTKNSQGR